MLEGNRHAGAPPRVKPLTTAKVVLALSGVAIFIVGIRVDNALVRWAGTGLVAAAWLLRFVKDTPPGNGS